MIINVNDAKGADPVTPSNSSFEEVDVPAIQAELQERKLEKLPSDNLFSRDLIGQGSHEGVIDATVATADPASPNNQRPQIIETTPGRPGIAHR